jgi:hypothetical protein
MRTVSDYSGLVDLLFGVFIEHAEFTCEPPLREVLKKHAKLIGLFSHSTPLSWLPVMCLLQREYVENGGGQRVPLGIFDRFFYDFKPLRPFVQWLSQSVSPLGFGDLAEHFRTFEQADLIIFPEGSNCFFGDPNEVQEFRSNRILELAIKQNVPVLLGVHRGSESWADTFHVPDSAKFLFGFLPELIGQSFRAVDRLVVPRVPRKIQNFRMHCVLYTPSIRAEDLEKDRRKRREQVNAEGERLRQKMIEMLTTLDTPKIC